MTLPPIKTHRVSVPITQKSLERFQRYSEASGVSIAKSISQWLDDTSQGLEPMTEIVLGMKAVPLETIQRLTALSSALEQTSHQVIEAARTRKPLVAAGRSQGASADGFRPLPTSPPSSNTGGKVSKKVLQKGGKPL